MSSSFSLNENALRQMVDESVAKLAADQTRDLDQLRHQYAGHPIDEIKPALQRLFEGYGGSITEPELSDWAQLIADNTRIEMKPEPVDWSK